VIGFAPKIQPQNFKAPFTAAEGWGTFSQEIKGKVMNAALKLSWGKLALKSIRLVPIGFTPSQVEVFYEKQQLPVDLGLIDGAATIDLSERATIETGTTLEIKLS